MIVSIPFGYQDKSIRRIAGAFYYEIFIMSPTFIIPPFTRDAFIQNTVLYLSPPDLPLLYLQIESKTYLHINYFFCKHPNTITIA